MVGGDVGGGNGGTHKWVLRSLQMSVLARRTAAPHSSTVVKQGLVQGDSMVPSLHLGKKMLQIYSVALREQLSLMYSLKLINASDCFI